MDWLTTRPRGDEVIDAFTIVSLLVFVLVVIIAGYYGARPWAPPLGETYSKRFVSRAAAFLAWPAGFGLFFLIIRMLHIDPATFGRPIWIVLCWLALFAAAIAIGMNAPKDREAKRLRKTGHRPSQLSRRPVRKKV